MREGAAQIGAGNLEQRISIKTGDELELLADQFNDMAGRLEESYAGLEQKVEQRTHELSESLAQQTATSEVLQVITSSPGELEPVFQAMLKNATRICDANFGMLWLTEGKGVRVVAIRRRSSELTPWGARTTVRDPAPRNSARPGSSPNSRLFTLPDRAKTADISTVSSR